MFALPEEPVILQHSDGYMAAEMTGSDPRLADAPTKLWDRHKYDVGLMENVAPPSGHS